MSNYFIGEIRMFGGNFAPAGWAFCNGQLIAISDNDALFNLIGTTYGGDGQSTFALPNLQSRVPIHMGTDPHGTSYVIGTPAGQEQVLLSTGQMPTHTHTMGATTTGQQLSPLNAIPATVASSQVGAMIYATSTAPTVSLNATAVGLQGSSLAHSNIQPFLAVSYIISLYGIYPTQN